ncbi:Transcriptional activator protein acu-15 [Cyphellophora attinorum]|uniref:Transcriptional activator protein acu-15 n=1 Tax=Cyphellophora attinorum TaxID=1664694 RepID=A0A0N1HCV5_9EURO|nr:Transcriptional activator protein acu-15 [Phialophora attinorum]KPI42295.1 Transcriptional activator protein acu-15 [Phialophora attinorum]
MSGPKPIRPNYSPGENHGAPLPTTFFTATTSRRRSKIEQACSRCRSLRRKCDGLKPCATCREQAFKCEYEGGRVGSHKLTLAKAVCRIAQLEEELRHAKAGLQTSETKPQPTPGDEKPSASSIDGTNAPTDEWMSILLQGVDGLSMTTGAPEFYGPSSANAIIDALESSEQDSPAAASSDGGTDRARLWLESPRDLTFAKVAQSSLPPKEIADEYLAVFYQTAHRIYPILNRAHFMKRYNDFWKGLPTEGNGYEHWVAVLCMVLALGHQCSTADPDVRVRSRALQSQHGEECFGLAKAMLAWAPFSGGDMSVVNSFLLAYLWLYNQQRLHEAYTVLGASIRTAYAIGLHRDSDSSEHYAAETDGWTASWWCLFAYETELAAISGRPSAIQPRELDMRRFSQGFSSIDLQYVEYLRQLSAIAWEVYEQVYSLSLQHVRVAERIEAVKLSDEGLCGWYETWYRECEWSREPHGLLIRLRYLNMRILYHRGFLKLVTLNKEQVPIEATVPATKCVHLACELIETITASVNRGGSGILQAAVFGVLGYLWNATITLLLYALSERAIRQLDLGSEFSDTEMSGFAGGAAQRARRLLERFKAQKAAQQSDQRRTLRDVPSAGADDVLESFGMLDHLLSGFSPGSERAFDATRQYDFQSSEYDVESWINDNNESYSFDLHEP